MYNVITRNDIRSNQMKLIEMTAASKFKFRPSQRLTKVHSWNVAHFFFCLSKKPKAPSAPDPSPLPPPPNANQGHQPKDCRAPSWNLFRGSRWWISTINHPPWPVYATPPRHNSGSTVHLCALRRVLWVARKHPTSRTFTEKDA